MMSPYDKQVYDAGFKYIPRSEFLLDPFQIPGNNPDNNLPRDPGLPSINMGGGGSGGFNPYNPDMNQIRTDFNPRAYNLAMRQGETVGPNPDLFYAPQSKIGGLMDFIPGIGTIRRGAEFLKKIMPINERAIMENEARGMGIFTDDIGRVVAGPGGYNTAQGIMAGYNLNKIDQGTFDKRRATIEKAIERRKASGQDYSGLTEKLGLLDEAEDLYLGPLKTRTDTIYKYRKDKKDAEAAAKKAEEDRKLQEEINAYNKRQAEIARRSRDRDNDGVPDYVEDAGGSAPGGIYSTDYQGDSSPSSVGGGGGGGGGNPYGGGPGGVQSGMSSSSSPTNVGNPFGYMDGGRVAYMLGGLADLVDIYD
jgi:hypothetical protein